METNQADQINPNWPQPQTSRRGCGLFSCLMIGCGGMLLLCCGGVIGGVFYFRSWVSEDPAAIAAAQKQIAEIVVPDGLEPKAAINMKLPFVGEIGHGVVYLDQQSGSNLLLLTINRRFAEEDGFDFDQAMRQSLQQQNAGQEANFRVTRPPYERKFTVRGEEVAFRFAEGENTQSGKKMLRVSGAFSGDSGPVIVQFLGDAEKYDEETIAKMIESIR